MKSPAHAAVPAGSVGTGEAPGTAVQPGKVLGIFDLGSNSVRLMLVRVGPCRNTPSPRRTICLT